MVNKLSSQHKLYSPSMRGFYDRDVHGKNIPLDSVQVTNERWRELLDANSRGMDIVPDRSGFPQAVPHMLTDEQRRATFPFRQTVALRRASDMIERHRDELDVGEPTTLTDAQYKELVAYRHAVRSAVGELPQAPDALVAKHGQ